jgi:hypothetical protein
VPACLPTDYAGSGSDVTQPTRQLNVAAHTILAIIDALSTVFKTREHTAHVSWVGYMSNTTRCCNLFSSNPSLGSSHSDNNSTMPKHMPMAIRCRSKHGPKGVCGTYR